MSRRDWVHAAGWALLVFLLWRHHTSNQSVVALAAATKALEKTAAMESSLEQMQREIERLKDQNDTQTQVDANQNRQIQFVKAQQEIANGQSSVQGSD